VTWDEGLAAWWLGEVAGDPSYAEEVVPLALETIRPEPGSRWLDLGCGEGQVMRALAGRGAGAVGCDASPRLAARAAAAGPVVIGHLPDLAWAADASFDGACAVLVVEHLRGLDRLLAECHRVVGPGGGLALVVNHPVITSVGSAPVVDPGDGEVLWRWGDYFGEGATTEPAGEGEIRFHHRSTARYLNAASQAGWRLERIIEQPVGEERARRDPLLALQTDIPRLMGIRWSRP
jgi:SAM-dependent methyltransferase